MPSLRHNKRQSCLVNSLRTKIFLSTGSRCKNLFTLSYIVEVYGTKYGLGLSRNVWLEMLSEAFTSSTLVSSRNTIGCEIVPGLLLERWSWFVAFFHLTTCVLLFLSCCLFQTNYTINLYSPLYVVTQTIQSGITYFYSLHTWLQMIVTLMWICETCCTWFWRLTLAC